jgi:hypothetical protein
MENKSKISVEIPSYLKEWIDKHDISQNALVTNGLRHQYLQEQKADTDIIIKAIEKFLQNKKLPF